MCCYLACCRPIGRSRREPPRQRRRSICASCLPFASSEAKGSARFKSLVRGVERLAAFFLLEEVRDDIAASRQADLVALDLGDQAAGDEVMMLLMPHAAVGTDQLDPVVLDPIDGADVDAVRADHFHMLANLFEAAHGIYPPLAFCRS